MEEMISRANLMEIFNKLREGVIVYNLDYKIVYFNNSAKHLGFDNDVIGKSIFDIYKNIKYADSMVVKVAQSGKPVLDKVHEFVTANKKRQVTLCSTYPLYIDGDIIGIYEIFEDISNVMDLNEKLITIQKKHFTKKRKSLSVSNYTSDSIIGKSEAIRELKSIIPILAKSKSPILVYGETGTGKELIVQAIHYYDSDAPFIAQNCAAIPESLLESILFGTTKGGFTGAEDREGLFELAHDGTLFLDELNSMSLSLQAKLLRAIQEKKIRRIGGQKEIPVNVRIIATTNVDPITLLEEGKIRADLYYRLSVLPLYLPPLRERVEDIPLLIDEFIDTLNIEFNKHITGVDDDVLHYLMSYDWPGNIRELRNLIERAMNIVEGSTIKMAHLQLNVFNIKGARHEELEGHVQEFKSSEYNYKKSLRENLSDIEKEFISECLKTCKGNISQTARKLNVPQQSMSRKIKQYNLHPLIYDIKKKHHS